MEPCQHVQDLLLDSLYGLLEADEEEVVRAHVAVCPDCAAALAESKKQHDLLARAAQVISQVPVFVAPEERPLTFPAPGAEPEILPLPISRRRLSWKRWVGVCAAAAILLAAGIGWNTYQRAVDDRIAELARARKNVEAIDGQFAQVQDSARKQKESVLAQPPNQIAHLQVVGPASYERDAPSPLRIATSDVAGKPLPSQIRTRLLSKEKKELYRNETTSKGEAVVSLPAGLKTAADQVQLVIEATSGEAHARVQETIRMKEPGLVTHLALNKSVFQVGEVIFFRTLTLERFSLKPVAEKIPLFFTLVDVKGKAVKRIAGESGEGGIGGGDFALAKDLPAGEYTLRITQAGDNPRMLPQERRVEILRDLPPQFQFDQPQYFAGQNGKATFSTRVPAGGGGLGKPQDLEIKAGPGVSIAGKPPGAPVKMRTDAKGNAHIPFQLQPTVQEKDALLKILVENGANKEKVVQPIPVVASNLAVDFFPEGGDLLAGVPNRVYYRLRTPLGEPVNNPAGNVIIMSMREPKKVILDVEQKQGLGVFTFTPEINESYRLWITHPGGHTQILDPFKKINVLARGVALSVPEAVSKEGSPLNVVVNNTGVQRRLAILATCRGRLVAEEFLLAGTGERTINLATVAATRGVVRVTLYDASAGTLAPLAERLVYRIPAEQLRLSVKGLKETFQKGERANLRIEARDELGQKTRAWIGGAVVDERVLTPADLDAPSPQAHFFLLSDISRPEELEQADLLLADSPQGRKALDLFLGTQGWRRFIPAADETKLFAGDKKGKSEEVLFSRENSSPAALAAVHDAKIKESLDKINQDVARQRQELAERKDRSIADARLAALELARLQNLPAEIVRIGAGVLVVALLVAGVLLLVWGLVRVQRRLSPTSAFVGSCCSFVVCWILYGAGGSLPVPHADAEHMLAGFFKKAWPGLEEGQVARTIPPASLSAGTYALALAPDKQGEKSSSLPQSTTSTMRLAARNLSQLTTTDNRDKSPLVNMQPHYFQDRFAQAQKLQETLAKEAKSKGAFHPNLAGGGKGGGDGKKNLDPIVAREYPFTYKNHGRGPSAPATLLWHPNLDARDGSAPVSFDLPSSGATYRIILFGNTPSGRLGSFQGKLKTSK
jgi:hypothetical protein